MRNWSWTRGCLRADFPTLDRDPSDPSLPLRKSLLLVWPGTFTLSTEDGVVRVVDANGRIAAHVGDHVRTTSVAVSFQQARDQGLIHGLSEDCPGPYLLAGDEVTAISLNGHRHITVVRPGTPLSPARDSSRRASALRGGSHWRTGPGTATAFGLNSTDRPSRLLFWPPGFTPHVYRGIVHDPQWGGSNYRTSRGSE